MADILQEVSFAKWKEMQEQLLKNWTINVPYYYAFQANISNEALRKAFKFRLYTPFGDTNNGLVVIFEKFQGIMEYVIIPFSDDNNDKLEKALTETKFIDWTKKACVNLLCPRAVAILKRLKIQIGFSECEILLATTFYYDKNMAPFPRVSPPANTYISPVKPQNIPHINNSWPYKHEASELYFSTLAEKGYSYGLYSTTDHSLMAWVFLNEYNFICHLFCEEKCRKMGYSKYLLRVLVNEQLERGEEAYTFVAEGNLRSHQLFTSLGFKVIEPYYWAYVKK